MLYGRRCYARVARCNFKAPSLKPRSHYTSGDVVRARRFFFLRARGDGKNHRPYNPATGRACALPLRGFIRTVIFSATHFLVARARNAAPPTYATLLWLLVWNCPPPQLCCEILPANLHCENFASNASDTVCDALGRQEVHPKGCCEFFVRTILPEALPGMCAGTFWEDRAC